MATNEEKLAMWNFVCGTEPVTETNLAHWFNHVMPSMNVKSVLDEMLNGSDLFMMNGRIYTKPQKWKSE